MNIVHTEASCGWGGQEIRILEESRGLIERGHAVWVLCPAESRIYEEGPKRGVPTIALPIGRKNLKGLFALRRWLKQNPVDVINTHSSTDSWLAALACQTFKNAPPIVRTRHISSPIPNNWASRWLYTRAVRHVVTTGEALRQQVIKQTGADPARVTSVPTGIDPERFKPGDKREARLKLGLDPDTNYIGIVATLRSWKGHIYLLEAFAQLNAPGWKLLIVGDGPQRENILAKINELDIAGQTILAGQQNNPEDWLRCLDVFCLPSYANEGVPQAILQAMFTGLPIITTTIGAISEAVPSSEHAIHVPTQNWPELKHALKKLIVDLEVRENLGNNNRKRALSHCPLDVMLNKMAGVFGSTATGNTFTKRKPLISRFSIIIPQYKTRQMIEICLDSLERHSFLKNEIIVVDNNSMDESSEYLRHKDGIILIENKNADLGGKGHKQALDLGVHRAASEWIILFHSDTIVLKTGWDLTLREIIQRNPDIVGFSSTARDINRFDSTLLKIQRRLKEPQENFSTSRQSTDKKIMSYCFGVRKEFLQNINYNFSSCEEDVATDLYTQHIREKQQFLLLGRKFLINILWHTSNTTSVLVGLISDQKSSNRFRQKLAQLKNNIHNQVNA